MDIDLLWAIGGWFLIPDCMATFRTSSSLSETSTKSHPFLLFLSLLFIFLILVHSEDPSTTPSSMASSIPTRRLLADSSSSPTSKMNFHPKNTQNSHTPSSSSSSSSSSTRREFEAGAHEVPSGPNPISNR
ncbi:hypothetical protein ACSBR2_032249 [Camellia fascicularis]